MHGIQFSGNIISRNLDLEYLFKFWTMSFKTSIRIMHVFLEIVWLGEKLKETVTSFSRSFVIIQKSPSSPNQTKNNNNKKKALPATFP